VRLAVAVSVRSPSMTPGIVVPDSAASLRNVLLAGPTVATVSGPTAGDGLNGCALGRSKYTWTLTSDLGATAAQIS
jgi:hypothetical protein